MFYFNYIILKIVTETVNLHAFSLDGFILPTFQRATLKYVKKGCRKSKWKVLKFIYYRNMEDLENSVESVGILRVR